MGLFADKVALITGGGSGIGRALGQELARRGATVILADVNRDMVDDAARSIGEERSGNVVGVHLDVAKFEDVKGLIDHTVAKYGALHYLFNNAGIGIGGEARDVTPEDWQAVLDVNLTGVVNGVVAAYPLMVKQGFGHIVSTSSLAGLIPIPSLASYVTSKHGVVGLSTALRLEGADLGVKVSVVCPGLVRTPIMHTSKMVKMDREKALDAIPMYLSISPEECAMRILRGVERNKALIVITAWAKVMWWLYRISPGLFMRLAILDVRRARKNIRLES